jgi:hypothetical protein
MFPLVCAMICSNLMLLLDMMQSILLVYKFHSAVMTFYDGVMMDASGMFYKLMIIPKLLATLITDMFFVMKQVHQ